MAALVGVALAGGALCLFTWLFVYGHLRGHSHMSEWIDWSDTLTTVVMIAILGVVLALVPTLVMTRKYLKV